MKYTKVETLVHKRSKSNRPLCSDTITHWAITHSFEMQTT